VIRFAKKDALPPIAGPRDMMRRAGKNDTGDGGYSGRSYLVDGIGKGGRVTVIAVIAGPVTVIA
jgi:hypothetical protein